MSETVGLQHRPIMICGLPGSGKTTFLAALWALVTARDELTTLRFVSLRNGDATHLNAIAARWLSARVQERTPIGSDRLVSMNLEDASRRPVRLTFPDVSGEAYRRMWEDRDCDPAVAEFTASGSVLLFIHTDTIQAPNWVVDFAEISRQIGLPQESTQEVQWHPGLAPTQVQLVGLLQLLHSQRGVMAIYDEIMLGHHLEHVIKNALSYATPETNVEIRLRESPGQAIVEVFNFGPLIADTREIFALGVSDRPSPEHMGLGLYAARIHILEMGGNIHAENREGGVAFVITLSTPAQGSGE